MGVPLLSSSPRGRTIILKAEPPPQPTSRWQNPVLIGSGVSLLLTLFFFEPFLSWGYFPHTQEGLRYPVLLTHFQHALADGVWYPRWLPDLYGGYGYPTFVFYQPFFFYVATGVAWVLNLANPLACHVAAGLLLFVGLMGAFLLGHQLGFKRVISGVWCCCLFALTPYLAVDFNARGALSEFSAMVLTPWPVYALVAFHDAIKKDASHTRPVWIFVFSLGAIICAHPVTALFFFPLMMLMHVVVTWSVHEPSQRGWVMQRAVFQGLLALAVSSFYWWPVLQMKDQVNLQAATQGFYGPLGHLVAPRLLFDLTWMWGDSPHGLPVQLGAVHFLLALSGLWLCRRDNLFRVLGVVYVLGIVLMCRNLVSEWVWAQPTLLQKAQFPWRLLSVLAITQTVLAVRLVSTSQHWIRVTTVLLVLVLLQTDMRQVSPESQKNDAHTYEAIAEQVQTDYEMSLVHGKRYAFMNEFMPLGAEPFLPPRKEGPLLETAHGKVMLQADHTAHHIKAEVVHTTQGMVQLNQVYLAGWQVRVDGVPIPTSVLKKAVSAEGLIQFGVPVGQHTVEAFYGGPPGLMKRGSIALALLLWGFWFFHRRSARKLFVPSEGT